MNNIGLVKSNFCQFDCPFKHKYGYFYKLSKKIESAIEEDRNLDCLGCEDIESINYDIEDILNHEFDFLCKENCPLHKFIDRLKEDKIIN